MKPESLNVLNLPRRGGKVYPASGCSKGSRLSSNKKRQQVPLGELLPLRKSNFWSSYWRQKVKGREDGYRFLKGIGKESNSESVEAQVCLEKFEELNHEKSFLPFTAA